MSISLDSGHLTMKSSTKATIKGSIKIAGTNTVLPITIQGEFKDIPASLHEIYMRAMLNSYGDIAVRRNEDKEPMTIKEKKREWRLNRIVEIITSVLK
jgi:hypothetical protein